MTNYIGTHQSFAGLDKKLMQIIFMILDGKKRWRGTYKTAKMAIDGTLLVLCRLVYLNSQKLILFLFPLQVCDEFWASKKRKGNILKENG